MGASHLGIIIVALLLLYLVGGFGLASVGLAGVLIINIILGFILLFVANAIGINIPINLLTIVLVIIFGLGGLAFLALLALLGVYDGAPAKSKK